MVLHAGNKITFQSTTEMEWKNPMAEEEQAWMRMNCGKMRFGEGASFKVVWIKEGVWNVKATMCQYLRTNVRI